MLNKNKIKSDSCRLCLNCISEVFLKNEINKTGIADFCFYCEEKDLTFSLIDIADRIDKAISQHYEITSTEVNYFRDREGEPIIEVIGNLAGIDENIAIRIQELLRAKHWNKSSEEVGDEGPYDDSAYYKEKNIDDSRFNYEWDRFEKILKTENRYFGQVELLEKIFGQVVNLFTKDNKPVVIEAGPGTDITNLFRARVMQSHTELEKALKNPELEIGPPPSLMTTGGRMNAKGISVFYGAVHTDTTIAEVRPPIGSRVLVGKFKLLKKIKLLDVELLKSIFIEGSYFDNEFKDRWEHAKFLGILSQKISMPVMPSDESIDYLVTQVIADYLSSNSELSLDGIIYPSVFGGNEKKNIVLFNKSAKIKIDNNTSSVTDVSFGNYDEEGFQIEYSACEVQNSNHFNNNLKNEIPNFSIELIRSELVVHHIKGITVLTDTFPVNWQTITEKEHEDSKNRF